MEPCIALTSSEVIRPLGPEPETCWRSIPFSLATLFAFGDAGIRSELGDFQALVEERFLQHSAPHLTQVH